MNFGEMEQKGEQFLDSEKGEKYSDEALQKAQHFADQRTGDKYDDQIGKAEQFADEHIGEQDSSQPAADQPAPADQPGA